MQSFQIGKNEAGQRFDKYLKKLLSEAPTSFIYKMLRKKNITLNGKKADGSEKLCEVAGKLTGIKVKNMLFQELEEVEKYDGIWACSSILHLPVTQLADVMQKMETALKENGIIYTSFKYGTFSGERSGRFFTDMTEELFEKFLRQIDGLSVEEQWITSDVRPGRGEEQWLNVILRKRETLTNCK